MRVTLIELNTGSFTFQAIGRDLHEAETTLRAALTKHARAYAPAGADLDYLLELAEDANVVQVDVPAGLRDGEVIV